MSNALTANYLTIAAEALARIVYERLIDYTDDPATIGMTLKTTHRRAFRRPLSPCRRTPSRPACSSHTRHRRRVLPHLHRRRQQGQARHARPLGPRPSASIPSSPRWPVTRASPSATSMEPSPAKTVANRTSPGRPAFLAGDRAIGKANPREGLRPRGPRPRRPHGLLHRLRHPRRAVPHPLHQDGGPQPRAAKGLRHHLEDDHRRGL